MFHAVDDTYIRPSCEEAFSKLKQIPWSDTYISGGGGLGPRVPPLPQIITAK